jgi:hypothetical protein
LQHRVPLTAISHERKLRVLNKRLSNKAWFHDRIAKTDLADLAMTEHIMVDLYLISAFVEKWHEETPSFHIPNLIGSDPADAAKEITLLITLRTRIRSRF